MRSKNPSASRSFTHIPLLFWRGVILLGACSFSVFAIDELFVTEDGRLVTGLAYLVLTIMALLVGILGWPLSFSDTNSTCDD